MKIETLSPNSTQSPQQSASQSARDRAIARLMEGAPTANTAPVPNPTSVSPEELGALSTPEKAAEQQQTTEKVEVVDEGQTNRVESPSPEATKEEQPLSSQFAQLAKREKAIRAQQTQLKAERTAFLAEQEASKAKAAQSSEDMISKADLKANLWKVLSDLGYTYDDITQAAVNQPNPVETKISQLEQRMTAEIKATREAQEKAAKAAADQQTAAYEQAVAQIRSDVKQLVKAGDEFEAVRETASEEDVVKLITETFRQEKRLMTIEEAAKEVEDYLIEEATRLSKLKKLQLAKAKPAAAVPAASAQPEAKSPVQPQNKTLTNSMAAQRPTSNRERAIAAFLGTLDKK